MELAWHGRNKSSAFRWEDLRHANPEAPEIDIGKWDIMKLHRRQFLHLATGAAALPVMSRVARAQANPTRPITMVVPFAAGGPTDAIGRIIAEGMRTSLGQPVIIENVDGAGGTIGIGRVARAAGDGYTLLLKDFEPVSLVVNSSPLIAPMLLLSNVEHWMGWRGGRRGLHDLSLVSRQPPALRSCELA
jgi:hypothetical protein